MLSTIDVYVRPRAPAPPARAGAPPSEPDTVAARLAAVGRRQRTRHVAQAGCAGRSSAPGLASTGSCVLHQDYARCIDATFPTAVTAPACAECDSRSPYRRTMSPNARLDIAPGGIRTTRRTPGRRYSAQSSRLTCAVPSGLRKRRRRARAKAARLPRPCSRPGFDIFGFSAMLFGRNGFSILTFFRIKKVSMPPDQRCGACRQGIGRVARARCSAHPERGPRPGQRRRACRVIATWFQNFQIDAGFGRC